MPLVVRRGVPNRVRPRCPTCDTAMLPVFQQRPRGETYAKIRDVFHCPTHGVLARGRRKVDYF